MNSYRLVVDAWSIKVVLLKTDFNFAKESMGIGNTHVLDVNLYYYYLRFYIDIIIMVIRQ